MERSPSTLLPHTSAAPGSEGAGSGARCPSWVQIGVVVALAAATAGTAQRQPPPWERLRVDVDVLGSAAMEGRGTGQPGGRRAAAYIQRELDALLKAPRPANLEGQAKTGGATSRGSYGEPALHRQAVPIHGATVLDSTRLELVDHDGTTRPLRLGEDYVLADTLPLVLAEPVELVFVGFGISAPDQDYNDYRDVDVAGRVVVFLEGEPSSDDPAFLDGERPSEHASPERKFLTALGYGARGAILIPSPLGGFASDWGRVQRAFSGEQLTLASRLVHRFNVWMRLEAAAALFDGAARDFATVLGDVMERQVSSFPLATRLRFESAMRERDFTADNLVVRLPGRDPLLRDQHVVISAHYDGLGGRPSVPSGADRHSEPVVYPSVVDNATGTAALLELVRRFVDEPPPARSLIFLFATGEEHGRLGSRYFVDHPTVPLRSLVANINVDGLSIIDTTDEWVGVGAELSTLGELLRESLRTHDLRIGGMPFGLASREPFTASDQLSFAEAGVPSIQVMEGLGFRTLRGDVGWRRFVEWGRTRYHTPRDSLNQPIRWDAVQQHVDVLERFVRHVADSPQEPSWLPHTPWLEERLRTLAEDGR